MKLRSALVTAALAASSSCVVTVPVGASPPVEGHCHNISGVDLNELFDVDDAIQARFCNDVAAGAHWRPLSFWIVADGDDGVVYPDGYVPDAEAPAEDFTQKLEAVKVIVDGRSITVDADDDLLRTGLTFDQWDPDGPPLPMVGLLPRMRPLPVGEHTVEVVWVLRAMHCDGLSPNADENCLPAGETSLGERQIQISSRR